MGKKTEKTERKPETKAKETVPEVQETPPEAEESAAKAADTPPKEGPPSDKQDTKPAAEAKKRYGFPRKGDIKCPGCGLYETIAVSTQESIQVRQCTRSIPVCYYTNHTFKVKGTEVKITDCKQDT